MTFLPVVVLPMEPEPEEIFRSVKLSNEEWSILCQCTDSFAAVFREAQSQTIATYVTRGQLDEAVEEAARMNQLLIKLDRIQCKIMS